MEGYDIERLQAAISQAIYEGIKGAAQEQRVIDVQSYHELEARERQERIDKTAGRIWAAHLNATTDSSPYLHDTYRTTDGDVCPGLADDCDATYRFAIALEAARTRSLTKEKT
jgi:hypothetical protein